MVFVSKSKSIRYKLVLEIIWLHIFYLNVLNQSDYNLILGAVRFSLQIFQTVAVLEVLYSD